jgi:hypothetical protein
MNPAAARAAVIKELKARGAKARRGHLRLAAGDLWWYVDPVLRGPGVRAELVLEVGCWTSDLPPEPDGGAVDCPLLFDHPVSDPVADTSALVGLLGGISSLEELRARLGELPGVLVDQALRDLFEGA